MNLDHGFKSIDEVIEILRPCFTQSNLQSLHHILHAHTLFNNMIF
jgi:hypothetical protein